MKPSDTLWMLAAHFAGLSLLAFGGANAVIPEMHRFAVGSRHWMTDQQFTALFAIAQAAPGPNFLISTLVGWKAAGAPGAVVATLAMCGPSCVLAFWAARLWDRYRDAPWRQSIGRGLGPVTVGLVAASAWLLSRATDTDFRLAAITAAAAAAAYFTRINPLWCLAIAAGLGVLGLG